MTMATDIRPLSPRLSPMSGSTCEKCRSPSPSNPYGCTIAHLPFFFLLPNALAVLMASEHAVW